MKECLHDQKETEVKLHLADILIAEKSINAFKAQLQEYEQGMEPTL